MMHLVIPMLALSLLAGLLFFAKRDSVKGTLLTKPSLSALFVIVAFAAAPANPRFHNLMLAGFMFCAAGDVLLIFHERRFLQAGLLSFLAGHLFFILAFLSTADAGELAWFAAAFCLAAGGGAFLWMRRHLGSMIVPVLAYTAVVSAMVVSAASMAGNEQLAIEGRVLAFCGAMLFYFSDFFVARERFVKRGHANQLIGLPMYYAGQFMLACSLYFF